MARKRKASSQASASGPRDFVAIAVAYAEEAVADRRGAKFGKWVRLAAKRFLADLKRAVRPRAPFVFDAWHAVDACRFIECLPHVEGTWDTPNIVLHPAHVFATVNIFGFRKRDGSRRFTTALYAVARKNAKSTWASAVLLYCEIVEKEVGPQVVSAATTGAQARIVFGVAKRMVEKTPDLREAFLVEPFANSIVCGSNGGTFRPINAKASTQDGLNPSAVCLDELHAHKTHDLLNVLKSAAGGRRNPLWLYTTTEGYETPGPWPEERKFAQQVLEGVIEADHYFAVIYALDEEDDDFDPARWIKANPLMDVNDVLAAELEKGAIEAKAKPGALAEFRIKRLNRQAATASGHINLPKWKRCDGAVDIDALNAAGAEWYGGLDLSATTDLASLRASCKVLGRWYTFGRRWVPADQIKQRTERGTVPYAAWVAGGWIIQTEGDVTDYDVIEAEILALHRRLNFRQIAFDPWNATHLTNRLAQRDVPLVPFIQGPRSYHPAMQEVDRAYLAGNLAHGGDPVLMWNAANLVARRDENNNMAPSKKRSAEKIDDMCALYMSVGAAIAQADQTHSGELMLV